MAEKRGLDAEAARVLRPTQMTVLHGPELGTWIRKRRAPQPTAEVLEQFGPATQAIAKGVEQFFYMSAEKAVPLLEPVVDLAWHHPDVLAFRPDLADQIWQAGIVLVRALAETSGTDDAQKQALRLVTLFPSRDTDPKVVPPDIRKLLNDARDELGAAGAKVRLSAPDPDRCALFLNGGVAEPQQTYVVDPQGSYFAHTDCSEPTAPPVWTVAVVANQTTESFIAPVEPQGFRATEDRRLTEWYLQAVAGLADTDVTVGVMATDDEAVVLVRYDRATQSIVWSDDEYSDSIRRGMPRIFPEFADVFDSGNQEPAIRAPSRREPRPVDWVGVGAVGGGLLLGGVGTYMVVSASRQGRLLDCAVNNPSPPTDRDCAGLRDDIFFDDFAGETRKVGSVRVGGYVMIGLGVLAAGFGVYRFVRPPAAQTAWRVTPSGMEVRW